MKQTAVEWLVEQLNLHEYEDVIKQAKEMEKEQILDARLDGFKISAEGWNGEYPFEGVTDYYIMLDIKNEQYYNETFKSE
jgi:hypothetical protein